MLSTTYNFEEFADRGNIVLIPLNLAEEATTLSIKHGVDEQAENNKLANKILIIKITSTSSCINETFI